MSGVLGYLRERLGDWHYLRLDVPLDRTRPAAEQRSAILKRVGSHQPSKVAGSPVVRVDTKDGYKFYTQDGSWLLVRPSGTEPVLRIYTETTSPERVQTILQEGRQLAGV